MAKKKEIQKLDRDYLTVKQAADYLQVSTLTIYQWIQRGKLESSQIVPRGRRLIAASTIEKLLKR